MLLFTTVSFVVRYELNCNKDHDEWQTKIYLRKGLHIVTTPWWRNRPESLLRPLLSDIHFDDTSLSLGTDLKPVF